MKYTIEIQPAAQRQFAALDRAAQARVDSKIVALAENPRPPGAVKLAGASDTWRVRVGDWRILYSIRDRELVVLVIRIGHRREVYR